MADNNTIRASIDSAFDAVKINCFDVTRTEIGDESVVAVATFGRFIQLRHASGHLREALDALARAKASLIAGQ